MSLSYGDESTIRAYFLVEGMGWVNKTSDLNWGAWGLRIEDWGLWDTHTHTHTHTHTWPQKTRKWGAVWCSVVQKTENDKKSTFSYIDMIYIIGKLMTCVYLFISISYYPFSSAIVYRSMLKIYRSAILSWVPAMVWWLWQTWPKLYTSSWI